MPTVTAPETTRATELAALFAAQRRSLWALAYRLTGSGEDAEDAVQEAFTRLAAQPERGSVPEPGRWLVRVVTHLAIDALRRRRRRRYVGPWLPSPVEGEDDDRIAQLASAAPDPERRYALAESASFAFLLALEALSPRQRAVLVLRDVLGHSGVETGERLGISEGNVRVLHLRARRALAAYDRERSAPTPELRARHARVLARFLACLEAQDAPALEALLHESVETLTDAGGAYTALVAPLRGRRRVARLYLAAALHRRSSAPLSDLRLVNGLPAALITLAAPARRQAPRSLLCVTLDADARIRRLYAVLSPRKLAALRP
jgi:RNA polymerase sigma-70 factor (ECF subfamily)